ncbi:GGDEF domain-containing protein [Candidatus Laterigemmans baculatus]|uniref:GGDEF domain-containing protein n=2 Tax=Candidatus Laterigemmans baculatus TaxID=2770505 RepID=UPI00193B94DE|nr:GGDEF domain-containing protein [Candidatus Laterigemmans baculatus]
MRKLRMWFALFFCWLFVLYNIERLHAPINIASFVYVLAALLAAAVVVFPPLQRLPAVGVVAAVTPLVVGLKFQLGYPITGVALPITVTELAATALTVVLAQQFGRSLDELRLAAIATLLTHLHDNTRPFEQGQAEIYREIRRARVHGRPLALLAISADADSLDRSLDQLTASMQRDCIRNYAHAKIAELLTRELNSCEIITHQGKHFLTVVPEAGRESARALADRLKAAARERLGLDLAIGTSLFPEEEITFVKLMERAESQMRASSGDSELSSPNQDALQDWQDSETVRRPYKDPCQVASDV